MKCHLLLGEERLRARDIICSHHYTHAVPSGKSHYFSFDNAIIVYSIPANYNIARFLLGENKIVWELTRLWAPNDHEKNLLTQAISKSIRELLRLEPDISALVSYADPNVGHLGGVYRAASWIYTGQSEESRYYVDCNGQSVSRRSFHSGKRTLTKKEIEDLGFTQLKKPGKHRFCKGLHKSSRKIIEDRFKNLRLPK